MGRNNEISCDIPGCESKAIQDKTAGSLEGWVRRDVTDSGNKRLAEGMRDSGFRHETFFICPLHVQSGQEVPSPPIHQDLVEWFAEVEENVPGRELPQG
jgi:hypothetical protein